MNQNNQNNQDNQENQKIKLEAAMQEINKVLDMHDIAGVVVLHTPQVVEYRVKINPSYSIASIDPSGESIRLKSKADATKQEKQKAIADTANMLHLFAGILMKAGLSLADAYDLLAQNVDITHTETATHTQTIILNPEKEN